MRFVMGSCFACARSKLQVTYFGNLEGGGATTPVYACRACVERLSAIHERTLQSLIRPRTPAVRTP